MVKRLHLKKLLSGYFIKTKIKDRIVFYLNIILILAIINIKNEIKLLIHVYVLLL